MVALPRDGVRERRSCGIGAMGGGRDAGLIAIPRGYIFPIG